MGTVNPYMALTTGHVLGLWLLDFINPNMPIFLKKNSASFKLRYLFK